MTGNLAESSNNCTQRKKKKNGWWNLSSYHTNHYLSNPLLQSKGASIFWRGNQGRGRKAVQINSDKGLFSAAFIYDGMLLCGEQGKGFIRPADTSLIARESSPLMKCCHLPKKISKSNDFPLKKTKQTCGDREVPEQPHMPEWSDRLNKDTSLCVSPFSSCPRETCEAFFFNVRKRECCGE